MLHLFLAFMMDFSALVLAHFLLFAFLWIGFDFIGAAANARGLNFASNIAGALFFISSGIVDFAYAIPMGLA